MSDEVRLSFPVYVIINQPYRLSEGYGGAKFANFITKTTDKCLPLFHHEVEAEEFIGKYGLDGATIVEILDESVLHGTIKHAKRLAKCTHFGWNDPAIEGGVCIHPID